MAELLSATWFDELGAKLAEIAPFGDSAHKLALGQVVEDVPGGPVSWTIHLGGGEPVRFEFGIDRAEVIILEDLDTMRELASGATTAGLLYEGRIKISGSIAALLGSADLLAQLNAALSA